MFTVYISHSVSPAQLAQVYVLAEETRRQGLDAILPHRMWDPAGGVPRDLLQEIQRSDAILLFATNAGHYSEWVNSELLAAQNKKVVAVVEQGVELAGIAAKDTVVFGPLNTTEAVAAVTNRLQQLRLQKGPETLLAALVIGGLVLLLLRGLGGKGGR